MLQVGKLGTKLQKNEDKRDRVRFLPDNINDAIRIFKSSDFIARILGAQNKEKYVAFKQEVADRSPKALGKLVKESEVIYHHEVTNQVLWNKF
jgi:glutamine synthetase